MSIRRKSSVNNSHSRPSPIDINTHNVIYDYQKCAPLVVRFNHGDCIEVNVNEQGTWKVSARGHSTSFLRGSHLNGSYRLLQFHAHWGGSEHTIDGKRYDGEIHFVYWNTRYHSPHEAIKKGDGLAVLGVLIERGAENVSFSQLLHLIEESHYSGKPSRIPISFDPMGLIPKSGLSRYFTYLGSQTTPPYSECVIWTIMYTPITFSDQQLKTLATLTTENWRECQKVHGRKIHAPKIV